jgi:hypothetical protein
MLVRAQAHIEQRFDNSYWPTRWLLSGSSARNWILTEQCGLQ